MVSWFGDLGIFLWAVVNNWAGYATGGIIVALLALWSWIQPSWKASRRFGLSLAGFFLFLAVFGAWRQQYQQVNMLQHKGGNATLSPQITVNVPPAQVVFQKSAEKGKVDGENNRATTRTKSHIWPSEPEKPEVPHGAEVPKPMMANVRIASQEMITSTDPEFPYARRIVIQTDKIIDPVAFGVACDGPVGKGDAGFSEGGVYVQSKFGQVNNDQRSFGFEWKSPAFTPDNPIVVTLYSKEYIQVLRLFQIRYAW